MAIRPCFSYYAQQKVKLRQIGMMISDFDLLIGCPSVVSEMVMVSENIKKLNRIDNVKLKTGLYVLRTNGGRLKTPNTSLSNLGF